MDSGIQSLFFANYDDEDIIMDTFVACYKRFDSFDPQKAKFATWLYVALNNRIKNYYRDRKDVDTLDKQIGVIGSQEEEIFHSIYLSEMRLTLALAMETLNEKQIIIKKYFRNMSSNKIADDIGSTNGTHINGEKVAPHKKKYLFDDDVLHIFRDQYNADNEFVAFVFSTDYLDEWCCFLR